MSRELTAHELEVAAQRARQLEELQSASADMRVEISARLGVSGRDARASELDAHLASLRERFVADPMLRVWWLTRLGVWVAWALSCELDGQWALDRDPASRSFLRAVVGSFGGRSEGPRYDAMQVAAAVVDGGESLASLMSEILEEVRSMMSTN